NPHVGVAEVFSQVRWPCLVEGKPPADPLKLPNRNLPVADRQTKTHSNPKKGDQDRGEEYPEWPRWSDREAPGSGHAEVGGRHAGSLPPAVVRMNANHGRRRDFRSQCDGFQPALG